MFLRAGRLVFAILAALLGCAAALDVYWHGNFTLVDPGLFIALAMVVTGSLLFGFYANRDRVRGLETRKDELEGLVVALENANTQLNASEARYKGLVDAQGDAIFRRTPDGRVTYANDALLKLFGLKAEALIGQIFRP